MKRILKTALLAVALIGFAHSSQAQLSSVCPTIKSVTDKKDLGVLVQYKNNQVQRAGSSLNSPVSGFLMNPTIIETQGKSIFSNERARMYDSKGKLVCTSSSRLGCASTRGECLARYKFPCKTSSVSRATRKGGAFVQVSKNLCVKVPDTSICYNVKQRAPCSIVR
jgi:hypothetical protein